MKIISVMAAVLMSIASSTAFAQTTPAPDGNTPAVATPDTGNPAAPVEGSNSFTEGQAKERIEAAGYTEVSRLSLDDKGVWQGTAMKDGKSVVVAMDYQGNVTAQ